MTMREAIRNQPDTLRQTAIRLNQKKHKSPGQTIRKLSDSSPSDCNTPPIRNTVFPQVTQSDDQTDQTDSEQSGWLSLLTEEREPTSLASESGTVR